MDEEEALLDVYVDDSSSKSIQIRQVAAKTQKRMGEGFQYKEVGRERAELREDFGLTTMYPETRRSSNARAVYVNKDLKPTQTVTNQMTK